MIDWDELSVPGSFSICILNLELSELALKSPSNYIFNLGSPSQLAYYMNTVEAHYKSPRDLVMVLTYS